MSSRKRFTVLACLSMALLMALSPLHAFAAQQQPPPATATPEEVRIYEAFRAWITNTIFLAQQGWDAVGFDPADKAVAAAQEQAAKVAVKITTHVARAEDFDWGNAQWDLIVLSYVGGREYVANVVRALRPDGMVLIEAFHRDATKKQPIGGAVVFDSNELLKLYGALRVVRYEDTDGVGDFGLQPMRIVRLFAQKAVTRD